jgi:short-subunit dehydrogenase
MNRPALVWSSGYSVITGAGSGFGRNLALALARRGSRLLVSDINRETLDETEQLCRSAGAQVVKTQLCDVRELAQVEALAAACDGPVNLLVNNAGVSSAGFVGEVPISEWRWVVEIDLFGVINGCHVFVPLLKKQQSGHILNVASAAGFLSAPRMAPYCVSKAGVVALSECLSAELSGTGVGITVLCPTFFRTNIVAAGHYMDEESKTLADFMMSRGRPVEHVVDAALRAVELNELYCLPMADARWFWRLKRASPHLFSKLFGQSGQAYYRRLVERAKRHKQTSAQ